MAQQAPLYLAIKGRMSDPSEANTPVIRHAHILMTCETEIMFSAGPEAHRFKAEMDGQVRHWRWRHDEHRGWVLEISEIFIPTTEHAREHGGISYRFCQTRQEATRWLARRNS